ncbi:M48 family metallopeptidase [Achromobacter kerstersii]
MPPFDSAPIHGRLFIANASAHRPATLKPLPDGSALLDDGSTEQALAPGALRWSSPIGTTARRATLADGAVFETRDYDRADRLARGSGQRSATRLHQLERSRARWLALVVVAVLAFVIGLRWTVPWLGDTAAALLPHSVEARIGDSVMDALDRVALHPSELPASTRQAILVVFDDLKAHANAPSGSLRLVFRQGGALVGANALALPGGKIVVTDELVTLAQSPEALAGVLAHEIGHVEHRHGIRQLGRVVGLSAVVMLMTGDISSMTHDIGVMGAGLLELSFSRRFELEADAHSVVLMRKTGRDPDSLAQLLERMEKLLNEADPLPVWLSSHPSTLERTRNIRPPP